MAKYKEHIIIVGTARSGTSWLSETIAQKHRYRMLFEPEHETQTQNGYLICDQWIECEEDSPKAHQYLKQVFANRVDSDWIAQNSNRKWKRHLWPFIPKKFIIKFVRTNLSAKYMNEAFQIPIIHIIRNPYDVIQSQMIVNFPWLADLKIFAGQSKLTDLIQDRFQLDITDYNRFSKMELLALRWCIENVIPLEILEPYQYNAAVIKYEDLVKDVQVFYDMCHQFNIDFIDNIEEIYSRPSSKTHAQSAIIKKQKTKPTFTSEDLKEIQGILNIFGTKLYPHTYPEGNEL